ncbi:MAG: recombinase family protein [Lachnospiraceae bacterium]|nr:recombinase family protein [Lachnospiraceae bacterium]
MNNNLACYIRLSLADGDLGAGKDESNSIKNQRELLLNYIRSHPEFQGWNIHEFVDDGYTGTNDDRPNFQRMIELAKDGQLQCIIVKDLSRFARNYVLCGDYLEQIFPFLGVRFIAVNDRYDSAKTTSVDDNMSMVLKSVLNAYYSKDISRKIFSSFTQRMKKGIYLGNTPYGYLPDHEHLRYAIDPEASQVVRKIFNLALSGKSKLQIAAALNSEGILPPGEYNRLNGKIHKNTRGIAASPIWEPNKIISILRNQAYMGDRIMRKQVPVIPGSKIRRKANASEQIIHRDAHEAIVTRKEFERVQELFPYRPNTKRSSTLEYTLKGVVRCGTCRRAMARSQSNKHYSCPHARMIDSPCPKKNYEVSEIEAIIFESLKPMLTMAVAADNRRNKRKQSADWLTQCQKEIGTAEFTEKRIQQKKLDAYEDYSNQRISLKEYQKRKDSLNQQASENQKKLETLKEQELAFTSGLIPHEIQAVTDSSRKYLHSSSLTRDMVTTFVDSIYVYEDHYEIVWKFRDVWKQLEERENTPSTHSLQERMNPNDTQ